MYKDFHGIVYKNHYSFLFNYTTGVFHIVQKITLMNVKIRKKKN